MKTASGKAIYEPGGGGHHDCCSKKRNHNCHDMESPRLLCESLDSAVLCSYFNLSPLTSKDLEWSNSVPDCTTVLILMGKS